MVGNTIGDALKHRFLYANSRENLTSTLRKKNKNSCS